MGFLENGHCFPRSPSNWPIFPINDFLKKNVTFWKQTIIIQRCPEQQFLNNPVSFVGEKFWFIVTSLLQKFRCGFFNDLGINAILNRFWKFQDFFTVFEKIVRPGRAGFHSVAQLSRAFWMAHRPACLCFQSWDCRSDELFGFIFVLNIFYRWTVREEKERCIWIQPRSDSNV